MYDKNAESIIHKTTFVRLEGIKFEAGKGSK